MRKRKDKGRPVKVRDLLHKRTEITDPLLHRCNAPRNGGTCGKRLAYLGAPGSGTIAVVLQGASQGWEWTIAPDGETHQLRIVCPRCGTVHQHQGLWADLYAELTAETCTNVHTPAPTSQISPPTTSNGGWVAVVNKRSDLVK